MIDQFLDSIAAIFSEISAFCWKLSHTIKLDGLYLQVWLQYFKKFLTQIVLYCMYVCMYSDSSTPCIDIGGLVSEVNRFYNHIVTALCGPAYYL